MARLISTLRYVNKTHSRKEVSIDGLFEQTPTEEAVTEEIHNEEYVINILAELFQLNHKYGQLLNADRKFRSTGQSANLTLKANRELSNEIAPPKKFNSDANSKDFTREQAQTINSINTQFNPITKSNNFDFTDSKMEKQFNYKYRHWGGNKIVMDIIKKREKSPETVRLIERRAEITKPENLQSKFDSNLNRKMWVPRRPDIRETRWPQSIEEFCSGITKRTGVVEVTLISTNRKRARAMNRKIHLIRARSNPNHFKHRRKRRGKLFVQLSHRRSQRL